jgi:hypothetical protein
MTWEDVTEGTLFHSSNGNTYVVTNARHYVAWTDLTLSVAAGGDQTGTARDFNTSVHAESSLHGFVNE